MQNQSTQALSLGQNALPGTLAEFQFQAWKDENPYTLRFLENEIARRTSDSAPPDMITQVGLSRYFKLLDRERRTMAMHFTEEELHVLLNANPYPWWTNTEHSLATAVSEHYGLAEIANDDSAAYRLSLKLHKLSALQEIALIDLLECAWRDDEVGPVAHVAKEIGSEPRIS
jgi:hypothetical protein